MIRSVYLSVCRCQRRIPLQTGPSFTGSNQSRDGWAPCIRFARDRDHEAQDRREVRSYGFCCLTIVSRSRELDFSNNVLPVFHCLLPLDPKSDEFTYLFRWLLTSNDERKTILELSEEDAKVFIEITDGVSSSRTFLALVH